MIGWNRVNTKGAREALKARNEAISAADPEGEFCQGEIQLEIRPFENFRQINKYTRYLSTIENLKIVSECWSEDEGYNIVVSAQVPLALGRLLQDMPEVAHVQVAGNKPGNHGNRKMLVLVKASEVVPEPVLV
jgi:hypothetical protein